MGCQFKVNWKFHYEHKINAFCRIRGLSNAGFHVGYDIENFQALKCRYTNYNGRHDSYGTMLALHLLTHLLIS